MIKYYLFAALPYTRATVKSLMELVVFPLYSVYTLCMFLYHILDNAVRKALSLQEQTPK